MQTTISARRRDVPALVSHGIHADDPGMTAQTAREAAEAEAQAAFLAEFGRRMRAAMDAADLNESRLSFASQIHETLLRRWLKGTTNPTATRLVRLADALGVSADYLLGRTEQMTATSSPAPAPGDGRVRSEEDLVGHQDQLGIASDQPSLRRRATDRTSAQD